METHHHRWRQYGREDVACEICGIEPSQVHRELDQLDVECEMAKRKIRRHAAEIRRRLNLPDPEAV